MSHRLPGVSIPDDDWAGLQRLAELLGRNNTWVLRGLIRSAGQRGVTDVAADVVQRRVRELDEREADIVRRETEMDRRETEMDRREAEIGRREEQMERAARELAAEYDRLVIDRQRFSEQAEQRKARIDRLAADLGSQRSVAA